MENSVLRGRVLTEIENLITRSCPKQKVPQKFNKLHVAIIKNHYNAADVVFDYHRRRVEMEVIVDDTDYNPKTVNLFLPTLHVNLWFRNLVDFLKECIDKDSKSVAYYARLLQSFHTSETALVA